MNIIRYEVGTEPVVVLASIDTDLEAAEGDGDEQNPEIVEGWGRPSSRSIAGESSTNCMTPKKVAMPIGMLMRKIQCQL